MNSFTYTNKKMSYICGIGTCGFEYADVLLLAMCSDEHARAFLTVTTSEETAVNQFSSSYRKSKYSRVANEK